MMLALKIYLTLAVCLVAPASAMGITRRLDGSAFGECESNPGFMLVQCKTACELKKLEEQYGTGAPPGDDGTYAYAPGGSGGDGDDWDDNGMFGYGAQGDDGYGYGAQGDDGYEYGAQDDEADADAATGDGSNFYDDAAAEA